MLLTKISKISSCLAQLQLDKFAAFLRHSVQQSDCISVIGSCVVKYFQLTALLNYEKSS